MHMKSFIMIVDLW